MSDEEFSLALGMGVVTGARSFLIDALGRLTGVSFKSVWTPGENVAECLKTDGGISASVNYAVKTYRAGDVINFDGRTGEYIMFDGGRIPQSAGDMLQRSPSQFISVPVHSSMPVSIAPVASKPKKDHSLSGCTHGFYGYYDGSNDYYKEGYVSGVIEGYGETIIGTRGFRVTKAKLVALSIDDKVKTPLRRLVQRNYKDVPQFEKFNDMVKAFPTDAGESAINPDTDAEFWTRKL